MQPRCCACYFCRNASCTCLCVASACDVSFVHGLSSSVDALRVLCCTTSLVHAMCCLLCSIAFSHSLVAPTRCHLASIYQVHSIHTYTYTYTYTHNAHKARTHALIVMAHVFVHTQHVHSIPYMRNTYVHTHPCAYIHRVHRIHRTHTRACVHA